MRRNSLAWLYQHTGTFAVLFLRRRERRASPSPTWDHVSLASSSAKFRSPAGRAIPSDLGCFIIHAPSSQTEICLSLVFSSSRYVGTCRTARSFIRGKSRIKDISVSVRCTLSILQTPQMCHLFNINNILAFYIYFIKTLITDLFETSFHYHVTLFSTCSFFHRC